MAKMDPNHQQSLEELRGQGKAEQLRRLTIEDYKNQDYVAAELLVSIIRTRYGESSGVLDAAGAALYKRMLVLIDRYFVKNPQWRNVIKSSSENLAEAVQYSWKILLEDRNDVSFAEVRFLPWIEARAIDYLQSLISEKNQARSLETMTVHDKSGRQKPYVETLQGDDEETPESLAEREELKTLLNEKLFELDRPLRQAVYFRLVCEYEWTEVAELLECSVPTARKYYKIAKEQLIGAM